ncbi:MAG: hypothetical protein KKH68_07880 [Proteobacteria bacterium]|nr:hypothetical protein [Pseudomonadota bacterium]
MKFNERTDFTEHGKREDQSIECVFADEPVEYIVQKHAVSNESDFMCRLTIKRSDREHFLKIAQEEIAALHEGNFARYRLRPGEFKDWQKRKT